MNRNRLVGASAAAVLVALAFGCNNKEGGAAPAKGTAKASSSAAAATSKSGKKKNPAVSEAGRKGECKFAQYQGAGKDRKAMFTIKIADTRKVDGYQTWLFYYDQSGKYLERYPHSTFPQGETQGLGYDGDKIPKGTETIECEITRVTFEDKTVWFNDNLVPNVPERPKGGFGADVLKAKSGEKVEVEVLDPKKGKVKLTNIGDKDTKEIEVVLMYFDDKGDHQDRREDLELVIKPGASVEQEIKLGAEPLPAFKSAEGAAPEVEFADGSKFENENLSSTYRQPTPP
jgi:hypothetical protein